MAKGGKLSNYLFSTNKKSEDAQLLETLLNDCGLKVDGEEAIKLFTDAKAAGMSDEDARAISGITFQNAIATMFQKKK